MQMHIGIIISNKKTEKMKHLFFIIILAFTSTQSIFAKSKTVTDTITVRGNCSECKERIEEAAYNVPGVKKATWNKKTKLFTVVYNANKTNMDAIATAISNVGHDAGSKIASTESYKSLPGCCAYRDGKCSHE
jgi:periplasmic mercuric ion binding protein